MKTKILLTVLLLTGGLSYLHAQAFSAWIPDPKPTKLSVRYKMGKDASGHNLLIVQVHSVNPCKMYLTATLCNKDPKEKNGWQYVQLVKGATKEYSFKIMNSCTNGFWWWYKNHTSGIYD